MQHIQYHDCGYPGDARSQGINSYGNDQIFSEYLVEAPEGLKQTG